MLRVGRVDRPAYVQRAQIGRAPRFHGTYYVVKAITLMNRRKLNAFTKSFLTIFVYLIYSVHTPYSQINIHMPANSKNLCITT